MKKNKEFSKFMPITMHKGNTGNGRDVYKLDAAGEVVAHYAGVTVAAITDIVGKNADKRELKKAIQKIVFYIKTGKPKDGFYFAYEPYHKFKF